MHLYEIRVLRRDRTTATVIEAMHVNDQAARHAARQIAGADPFEVWRDLDCIYGEGHSAPPSDIPTPIPSHRSPAA